MGFWDARLGDLEAAGVRFSDEEVDALERGGRLLHLHPFENAERQSYAVTERDPSGEVVLTLEVIRAISPLDRYLADWKKENITVAGVLDRDVGRERWTAFPAYVGVVDTSIQECFFEHPYLDYRADELHTYAWWNCIPFEDSMLPALRVLDRAQTDRHRESLWDEYGWITDMWENCIDPFDCWTLYYRPDLLNDDDTNLIMSSLENEWGIDIRDVESEVRMVAEAMNDIYSHGIWPFPLTKEDGTPADTRYEGIDALGALPWQPLEHFIPPHEIEALALWQRINARRRHGLQITSRTAQSYNHYPIEEIE